MPSKGESSLALIHPWSNLGIIGLSWHEVAELEQLYVA